MPCGGQLQCSGLACVVPLPCGAERTFHGCMGYRSYKSFCSMPCSWLCLPRALLSSCACLKTYAGRKHGNDNNDDDDDDDDEMGITESGSTAVTCFVSCLRAICLRLGRHPPDCVRERASQHVLTQRCAVGFAGARRLQITGKTIYCANAGDSRAVMCRAGKLAEC
jgi:hypothetical protein